MTATTPRQRRWPQYVILFAVLWIPIVALIMLLYTLGSNASPEANTAMQSTSQVTVTPGAFITFAPGGDAVDASKASTGYIFYPGGLVDPAAYALYAAAIAASGYTTFVTPMLLDLAVFNTNAAQAVMDAHPKITNWVIGGHSLGGAMAGQFVAAHPDAIAGLVLLGAYPNGDLANWAGRAVSIYGTLDGLAAVDEVLAAAEKLPQNTAFVPIEGGNHAQFGSYGAQSGDNAATISAAEQLAQAAQATLGVLDLVAAGT